MANDVCGTMKVVAKNRETIERLWKILRYEDEEFYISRCRDCGVKPEITPTFDGNLFEAYFDVDGAWNCERFFTTPEDKSNVLTIGYEKYENGRENYEKPIYNKAYLTNLCELAKRLDFGCELYDCDPAMMFAEHFLVNHEGELLIDENENYEENYPLDEDGEPDYDKDPEIICGFEDYMTFFTASEIYKGI